MNRESIITIAVYLIFGFVAQAQVYDSIIPLGNKLEEIVVSGQFNPQAINKSITNVTVINRDMIERQGASTLADVLNQSLNINIIPNVSTGKSGVKMYGLGSQYFKILVDNIPLVNEEGFGNNTDLTQISLDDIAQIEIVEGAMGVDYGANAATGIINIITKKSSLYNWEISPSIQEETVGSEYNFRDKGRHIQSLKIGHNISDDLYASVSYTHNDFKGYWDDRKGKYYDLSDGKRGYNWLPKAQNSIKGLLNYAKNDYRIYYKLEYFDETIKRFNPLVFQNYDAPTDLSNPTATDNIDNSKRLYNHLNSSGRFYDLLNFDISFSYQKQGKTVDNYIYRILSDEKFAQNKYTTEEKEVFYSKGVFSDFLNTKKYNLQLGYETSIDKGFSSALEGLFNDKDISKKMKNLDFFASSEVYFNNRFSIRPGYRIMTTNFLPVQHSVVLSAKYLFNQGYELRGHLGMSPRFPNFDELYTYFVDINHDVQGNKDLKPEKAFSYSLNLKKRFKISTDFELDNTFSFRGLKVTNLIDLVRVNSSPLKYGYENINDFQNYSFSYNGIFNYLNFNGGLGFTISGGIREMYENPKETNDILYSGQFNANIGYRLLKTGTNFSVLFKFNGPEYQYAYNAQNNSLDGGEYIKAKQDSYSILDATVRQPFYKKKFITTLGVRNILNIKSTPTTQIAGMGHSVGADSQALLYGTSVFFKLQYFLNF